MIPRCKKSQYTCCAILSHRLAISLLRLIYGFSVTATLSGGGQRGRGGGWARRQRGRGGRGRAQQSGDPVPSTPEGDLKSREFLGKGKPAAGSQVGGRGRAGAQSSRGLGRTQQLCSDSVSSTSVPDGCCHDQSEFIEAIDGDFEELASISEKIEEELEADGGKTKTQETN